MASDEQRPVDPRVSAYAKTMASKPDGAKRAVPFSPPRITSAKPDAAGAKPPMPAKNPAPQPETFMPSPAASGASTSAAPDRNALTGFIAGKTIIVKSPSS
jgi:hypothetical protein